MRPAFTRSLLRHTFHDSSRHSHPNGADGERGEPKDKNMKTKLMLVTLALTASTSLLVAQDGNPPRDGQRPPPREGAPGGQRGPGGPGGPGGARMAPPIVEALDVNRDGTIDADELAKASESLKKLDKNGDGKITADEYRPQRPGGPGGPDGPEGEGARGPRRGGPGGPGGPGGGERRPNQDK